MTARFPLKFGRGVGPLARWTARVGHVLSCGSRRHVEQEGCALIFMLTRI